MKDISANFLRAFLPAAALVILGSWISNPAHDWQSWGFAFLLLAAYAWILGSQLKSAAAEALAQQRYHAIFDHSTVGMARASADKYWLEVNPALCRILGSNAQTLLGKTWAEMTHPDDLPGSLIHFEAILRGESNGYSMERRFVCDDGLIIHTFMSTYAIRKPNGQLDCLAIVVEDLSNWILAEKEWERSAKTLQRFVDHMPGTAYIKDADRRILVAGKGFTNLLGVDPRQMIGHTSEEFFPASIGQKIAIDDARILASGKTEVIDDSFDGRHYESTKFVIPRDDGPADLGGITIDITARRKAELQLAHQARRSSVLLELPAKAEALPECEFMQYALEQAEELTQSRIGSIHFINDDGQQLELVAWSNCTEDRECTAASASQYPLSEAGLWADSLRQMQPAVINDYAAMPCKPGLPEEYTGLKRLLSVPVLNAGKVRMLTSLGNKPCDYTDLDVETVQLISNEIWRIVRRQRTESALRLAMQVVNASPVVCFRWSASEGWPVVFVSDNVKQWGYTSAQLIAGTPSFSSLIHPDDLRRVSEEVSQKSAAGLPGYEQEYRLLTAENKVIWVVDRTIVLRNEAGDIIFYDGVLTDITERKRQQLMLAENLDHQQQLNKRLEEANNQLLQSEKMASIGQLAAGIAHELNNPIGFVHSNLGTLDGYVHDLMSIISAYEEQLGAPADAAHAEIIRRLKTEYDFEFLEKDIFSLLGESKDGLSRVRKIVQDLKSFSHVGEQEWQEADLHQGIDSTLNIVWNELKYKCKVVKEYGDLPHIYCLISQLNQVFMNLLVNAGHAIETQGTITIRTQRSGTDMVSIEISDTGKGISPEHINRIFEPFFTTKPVGKGTGLGLSLSYSIVKRHSGRIEVDSQPGHGSTFRILLPIHPSPETQAKTPETFP
ncbi:PAS domain S-box protein [Dechloromonas denitrificans]|uniref:PAS domain S-box protein n=1 Tax=Dechloromonas denitrificans TaxID=281362 RepID=UPI001CF8EEE7|nr:PAS domain S-box protein [Dechloromonas denitrificans]UCV10855.1 PAS domain S-box protein [Dechloromonas denitrificans]